MVKTSIFTCRAIAVSKASPFKVSRPFTFRPGEVSARFADGEIRILAGADQLAASQFAGVRTDFLFWAFAFMSRSASQPPSLITYVNRG